MESLRFRAGRVPDVGLAALLALTPPVAGAQPTFTDVTSAAGLSYVQHAAQSPPSCMIDFPGCQVERMTGGAAVADVEGDGDLDLYVTRLDAPDILFLNQGDGTFADGTAGAGLSAFDLRSNGAGFADIDNDGDPDLYVTVVGDPGDIPNNRHYLFLNDGSGTFTEDAIARGADMASTSARKVFSVAFGDYDRDGFLDLHTAEWLPSVISQSRLLHNLGPASPGYFEDTTDTAGVDLLASDAFASTFTDLDGDGEPDLAVAADFETSRLFWNNGDGTFTDGTVAAGVATEENGMGSTFGDIDGDGDLDWFVTSIHDPAETCETMFCGWGYSGNRLYRNEGGRVFSDATDAAGVRAGHWGWGAAFLDYDNDADLDLVMTNGIDFPGISADAAFNADLMRLWENDGTGVMTEISATAGLTDTGSGKGLLVFDYDDDGDVDLFVVNNAAGPILYRNDGGNANGWLRVRTVGTASNRDGLGTWVTVQAVAGGPIQVREIGTSTHFLGGSETVAHFGLGTGSDPVALLLLRWPSGRVQGFADVARNTTVVAQEPVCTDGDDDGFCVAEDCDDADAARHPGAEELCDAVDNDCDLLLDELPACSVPSGWVPEGDPLTVAATGGDLSLSWGSSCAAADDDYEIYEGTLGDFASHTPMVCSTGNATAWTLTPLPGDTYYLVVPRNAVREGSYGLTGAGAQRPQGIAHCLIQDVGGCP